MLMLMILFAAAGAMTAWVLNLMRFNKKPCPGWLKWTMSGLLLILTIPLAIVASILAGMSNPNVTLAVMFVLMFHNIVNCDVKKTVETIVGDKKSEEKNAETFPAWTFTICPGCLSKQPNTTNFCSSCGSKLTREGADPVS